MNILIFSWRDSKHPLAGGAEQVMHEHAKGWIANGHRVTLFASKIDSLPFREELDGVEIVRGGYHYLGVQVAAFFHYIKNRKSYDFIVDQFHGIPFFTPIYTKKPKVAVIQETARKVWFLNPLPKPLNWIVGLIGFLGEPFVFLFYKNTHFITGSDSAKKAISKFGIPLKNITVVPHGVVISGKWGVESRSWKKEKVKTIVYLGVLAKDKGIEDAIKCFEILNKKGKFQFWVIGKAETKEYGEKIQRLVSKINLKERIKFYGFVSQDKKFELLSKAHILANPSAHEGWGLVNIEANSVGVPVVAYNSAGLVDSVKNGISGIICNENTPENLAKNILSLFNDEKLYEKLKQGSKKWSKNFSWNKSKNKSYLLIKKISNEI